MKKAVLSPLCSAFVIPGLGQVINQQLKKGVFILAVVFIFILAFSVELYRLTSSVLRHGLINDKATGTLLERILAQDYSSLTLIAAGFAVLWVYAVVDALIGGIKADHRTVVHTDKES